MANIQSFNLSSLNLKVSPLGLTTPGQVIYALNVRRDMIGAWKKRQGYVTFLGTPDNSQVNSLFSWTRNDGTSLFVYRASGSALYHSVGGTGAWTLSGNGTITNGGHFGFTVLDDVMIGGDGTTATRHTTTGTNFSDTTSAPLAELWTEFQGRVWGARGTAVSGVNTDLFYSTTGTATDWTTDSSSIRIPGPGRVNSLMKVRDTIVATKDGGNIFRYDGNELIDLATDLAPSSTYSIGEKEQFRIYLNRIGFMGFGGDRPEILSNPIERQIYNNLGSGIAGTTFDNAPGISFKYDYYCSVGTVTDDLIFQTIPNCVQKYDIQLNEWVNWSFANRPTAFGTYQDITGVDQMVFGDSGGQCYRVAGTATSDNGAPIESGLIGFIHGSTLEEKDWKHIRGMFNPGCRAKISYAISNTFTPSTLQWKDLGKAEDGVVEYMFQGERGIFLFWRIYEVSTDAPWQFYGWQINADVIRHE